MNLDFIISSIEMKVLELGSNLKLKFLLTFPILLLTDVILLVYAFLVLVLIDTFTGILYAMKTRTFRSSRVKDSLFKIFLYFLVIIVSRLLEYIISPIIETTIITQLVILIIALTEFSSILENLIALGVPLPKKKIIYTIVSILRYEHGIGYLNYKEQLAAISRDINLLQTRYLSIIEDKKLKEIVKIDFKIWEDVIYNYIIPMSFCRTNEALLIEMKLVKKMILSDFNLECARLKIDDKKLSYYKEINKKILNNMWEDIRGIIFSQNIGDNDKKKVRLLKVIVQTMYDRINYVIHIND